MSKSRAYIVGISGGSASGKTYFLRKLLDHFHKNEISVISQDNYYIPRHEQPKDENGVSNFDTLKSIDFDSYIGDIRLLRQGLPVERKEYTFNNNVQGKASDIFRQLGAEITCSVHFRRKDYLKSKGYHHNLDSSYYNQAINLVLKKYPMAKFLVFSDDIEWCKKNLPQKMIAIDTTAEGEDSMFIDMCIMSKCKIHIIANSSFSWWGAFLSRSAAVIAPRKWFGPRGPKDWQSVYVTGWITL